MSMSSLHDAVEEVEAVLSKSDRRADWPRECDSFAVHASPRKICTPPNSYPLRRHSIPDQYGLEDNSSLATAQAAVLAAASSLQAAAVASASPEHGSPIESLRDASVHAVSACLTSVCSAEQELNGSPSATAPTTRRGSADGSFSAQCGVALATVLHRLAPEGRPAGCSVAQMDWDAHAAALPQGATHSSSTPSLPGNRR